LQSRTTRHSVLTFAAVLSLACASAPKPAPAPVQAPAAPPAPVASPTPRAPAAAVTGLVFAVEPPHAQISVDGQPYGTVADLAARDGVLPLAPGIYQVSLKAPGYATWRAEVAIRAGTEPIRVTLAKKP